MSLRFAVVCVRTSIAPGSVDLRFFQGLCSAPLLLRRWHSIIDARRGEILRLINQGVELNRRARLFLAEKYGCSEATIEAEIKLLRPIRSRLDLGAWAGKVPVR